MQMCSVSIATINAFSKAAVNFTKGLMFGDPQLELVLEVAGIDTPFLYDTGAQANCMTLETYEQFKHLRTPPANGSTRVVGAGDNNLGLQTIKILPVKYKGQTYYESFMVCANLEFNIIGMPMINQLGLSTTLTTTRSLPSTPSQTP